MPNSNPVNTWSVAIAGSGGSGAVTAGMILLEALAKQGFYVFMSRSYGPQIRGGESAVMIRFASHEIHSQGDYFDTFLALDWLGVERFADEIPLAEDSVIICDGDEAAIPALIRTSNQPVLLAPFKETIQSLENGRANMVGLGVLAEWIGIGGEEMDAALQIKLGDKGQQVVDESRASIKAGRVLFKSPLTLIKQPLLDARHPRWSISGNEASGYGALKGGIRFVAAYPITPASEMLEYLAPRLEKMGGVLLQAEDELASINMIIGGAFGGLPSLTATSGPGLSLMIEAIGLAITSETPVVIACVTRGGPSTGIPTKTEQSDINIAVYGTHGDAPHVVLAPTSIKDTVVTTEWAVYLAEYLQTAVIVLTDQLLGQSQTVIDVPDSDVLVPLKRLQANPDEASNFQRYALTENHVSPMSRPGQSGGQYTADGLEHNQKGTPSSLASDHASQSSKRLRKIVDFNYGPHWADISGAPSAEWVLITWGSTTDAVQQAAARLRQQGKSVKLIAIRLISPLQRDALKQEIASARQVVVIELNQSGQLAHLLQSEQVLPHDTAVLCRTGPLFFRPREIVAFIKELEEEQHHAA